jgi:hypothetical protein
MTRCVAGSGDEAGNPEVCGPEKQGPETSADISGNDADRVTFLLSAAIPSTPTKRPSGVAGGPVEMGGLEKSRHLAVWQKTELNSFVSRQTAPLSVFWRLLILAGTEKQLSKLQQRGSHNDRDYKKHQ